MKAILEKAEIKNFKGIISLTVNFSKDQTDISGDNSTCKSSINDACMWCLTGKLANGSSSLDFKTYDKFNKTIHHVENEVVLTYDIDGKKATLKRSHKEKWGSPRGVKTKVLTGHETSYYINDVPKKQKEFDTFISDTFGMTLLSIVSSPLEINAMHWEKRRGIVMKLSSGMDDMTLAEKLIVKNKDFEYVKGFISEGVSIDDKKKVIKDQITKLKKDREELPVRIDEVAKELVHDIDKSAIDSEIKKLEEEIKNIENSERSISKAYKSTQEDNNALIWAVTDLKSKKRALVQKIEEEAAEKNRGLVRDRSLISDRIAELKSSIDKKEKIISNNIDSFNSYDNELEKLRAEYKELYSSKFVLDEDSTVCPTCKRELDDAEDIAEQLEKNFNSDRAKNLESNISRGQSIAKIKEELKSEVKEHESEIESNNTELSEQLAALSEIVMFEPELENEETKALDMKIEIIEKSISEIKPLPKNEELEKKKIELQAEIRSLNQKSDAILRNDEKKAKIEAYTKQISETEDIIMLNEKNYDIIESFEKERYNFIEEEVNSKFSIVKFKLWDYHINGSNKPCCIATVNGVPFEVLNTAGKVKAGLDIIKTISDHAGIYLPVWIDNRESVVEIPEIENQVINLRVVKGSALTIK